MIVKQIMFNGHQIEITISNQLSNTLSKLFEQDQLIIFLPKCNITGNIINCGKNKLTFICRERLAFINPQTIEIIIKSLITKQTYEKFTLVKDLDFFDILVKSVNISLNNNLT